MTINCAQGFLATGLGLLALGACAEPELNTNLRPEGDPEVLTVLVYSDSFSDGGTVLEKAVYCKAGDDKVPTLVGLPDATAVFLCPEDGSAPEAVEDANPLRGQVRVVFDELLDPTIEELFDSETGGDCTAESASCFGSIAAANPVEFECTAPGGAAVAVAYDGYYAPNGNSVSYPPGPSLVVQAQEPIPSGGSCTVTLNTDNIKDKDGNTVPTDQTVFSFTVSGLALVASDPEPSDPPAEISTDGFVTLLFSNYIDLATIDATEIVVNDGTAEVPVVVALAGDAPNTAVVIAPASGWVDGTSYTLTIPTDSEFADEAGGTLTFTEDFVLPFTAVAPPTM